MEKTKKIKLLEFTKLHMGFEIAHDYDHALRASKWAKKIARKEGYKNIEQAEVAALLHDIGFSKTHDKSKHGKIGAELAAEFLSKENIFTQEEVQEIYYAIEWHDDLLGKPYETELSNIVIDSDVLELLGPIGIIRGTMHWHSKEIFPENNPKGETWQLTARDYDQRFKKGLGKGNYIVDNFNFQISCFDNLSTQTAKEIAKPLKDHIINFIKNLEKQVS